ncbi:MAG TPA: hypothetical protein VGM03_02615 [Phycisphaerae bacterium]|jgi:hypothetical protein
MPKTFTISPAHLEAFSQQQQQRFEDEMVAYLTREHPAEAKKLGEPGMRDLIRQGIEKAKGYNIVLESDVARYIELMLTVSPDFDQADGAPEILRRRRLSGMQKLDALENRQAPPPAAEVR